MPLNSEPAREDKSTRIAGDETDIEACNSDPKVTPTVGASQSPPTEPHYNITCKAEKDWWDKAKPVCEIVGIALLAVYTYFTIKMYCANKEAANAARSAATTAADALKASMKQAIIENRPILWASDDLGSPVSEGGVGRVWEWSIKNYGKTPALDVRVDQQIAFDGHPRDCWKDRQPPDVYRTFTFPAPITFDRIESARCLYPPESLSGPFDFDRIMINRGGIQVRITLNYGDIYNIQHTTFLCLESAGTILNPKSKVVFCENPKSHIDTEQEPQPSKVSDKK